MAYEALVARPTDDHSAFEDYRVERSLEFAHGRVEVWHHSLGQAFEEVCSIRDDVYLVNLALSRRPTPTTIAHLGPGKSAAAQAMGRIVLMPPGCTVRLSSGSGEIRSLQCALDASLIERLLPGKPEWSERRFRQAARVDSPELEWVLLRIYRELTQRAFGAEAMVEALTTAFCVELIRRLRLGETEDLRPCKGGLAPWRMRLVRERAYAEAPAPTLAELSALCGMTVRQLTRAFKAETGQTLGKFVEKAMLERARALLVDSNLTIAEISKALGFSHPASFSYAFRRATGVNPSEVDRGGSKRPLC